MDERKPWQQPRQLLQLLRRLAVKPPAKLRTWQLTAVSAVVGLVVAAVAIAAAGPWDSSGQRTAERELAASREAGGGTDHAGGPGHGVPDVAPSAPSVLAGLSRSARTVPESGGPRLADVLRPLMDDSKLGRERSAVVVDVASGKRLYAKGSRQALTPASTTKIATAVAALSALGPDHRLTTKTVVEPGSRNVVLVGGGDPTLTARGEGRYVADSASLRELADDTAKALKKRGADQDVALSYDASRYSGPPQHPIGPNENIAPVSALMADEGRLDTSTSGPAPRTAEPARDAAHNFANLLRERGIGLKADPVPARAPQEGGEGGEGAEDGEGGGDAEDGDVLAKTQSPPLSALVERMLTHSDNDIAEALARETAVDAGEPASFEGGSKAVRAQLDKLGLPLEGAVFADGSGLDRDDRLTAKLLAALLKRASGPGHPELRSVVTGLPVAGFTGTLVDRYPSASVGTGVVRAKTGTLTGVNSLAGTVVDAQGRLLVFAFMTTGTTDPQGAQSTLDAMASALAARGA